MKVKKSAWVVLAGLVAVIIGGLLYIGTHHPGAKLADPNFPAEATDTGTITPTPTKKDTTTKQPTAASTDTGTKTTYPSLGDQTPWMHGPSDQPPAEIGAGVSSGATIDPSIVPWGQGPSDQ